MIRNPVEKVGECDGSSALPKMIVFPYARHSSLPELRHLVETFKPRDIWPCTVDLAYWSEKGFTMQGLFGDICSGDAFMHDHLMDQLSEAQLELRGKGEEEEDNPETQATTASRMTPQPSPAILSTTAVEILESNDENNTPTNEGIPIASCSQKSSNGVPPSCPGPPQAEPASPSNSERSKRDYDTFQNDRSMNSEFLEEDELFLQDSQVSAISDRAYETRLHAFRAARANMEGEGPWRCISLISTTDNHSAIEMELGGL